MEGPGWKFIFGRRARAAGMGTWVEGLTSLHRLSSTDPRLADKDRAYQRELVGIIDNAQRKFKKDA